MKGIPGYAWIIVGAIITGVSGYIGFIFETEKPFFFKLNTLVGIVMLGYGLVKIKLDKTSAKRDFEEKKHQILTKRQERFDDIDMSPEDYQKKMMQQRQMSRQHVSGYQQGHMQNRNYPQQNPQLNRNQQNYPQGQYNNQGQYAQQQRPQQNHPANQHHSHPQHNDQQRYNTTHNSNAQNHPSHVQHTPPTHQQHNHIQPQQQEKGVLGKINSKFGVQRGGYCPSCGTPLLKTHKFCPLCGGRV